MTTANADIDARAAAPIAAAADPDRIDPKRLAIFAFMTLGMFMAILDIQIVAASLPQIQAGLAASADQISWIQTSYLIAEVMMIPISGYLARALSTRVMFSISAAGFTLASLLCGLAPNMETLIILRAIQGFLGGAMIPLVFSTSITAFPRSRAAQLSAGMGLIVTMAPTVGPTLGGAISEYLSWHWLFFVNVVPGALITAVVWLYADFDKPNLSLLKKFDATGFVLLAVSLGFIQFILEEGPGEDWFDSRLISTMTIVALAAGVVFFGRMRGRDNPLVDFAVYKNPNFTAGSLVAASTGVALFGLVYVLPLFLARIRGFNSLQVGETVFVTGGAMFLAAPLAAMLSRQFDPRAVSAAGLLIIALSTRDLVSVTSDWGYWELFWPQVFRGAGLMLVMAPLNVIALGTLDADKVPNASGLFNLSRNLGGAFGLAVINTLLNDRTVHHTRMLADKFDISRPAVTERLS
ncbi:MAG TPA: DHA2 family efflux MFS transporter permease subunit, partial [Parvularculaceae bacterium]|nr:DHA2 family efflux MFS transporter permease subunit [Parvularculaceae bacterium]